MNATLSAYEPGDNFDNPIRYGKWRIYRSREFFIGVWFYVHEEYDPADDADDQRFGYEDTVQECKSAIQITHGNVDGDGPD